MTAAPMLVLAPVQPARHLPLIAAWLGQPHVARWFGAGADTLRYAENPPPAGRHAIIEADARPVGYVRWQTVSRDVLDSVGLSEIPAGSVDIDLFIGDPSQVGRGIGPGVLTTLLALLRQDASVPLAGLTTSIDNHAAARAFERAGFRKLRRYTPPDFGECWLMVADLRTPAAGTTAGAFEIVPPPAPAPKL